MLLDSFRTVEQHCYTVDTMTLISGIHHLMIAIPADGEEVARGFNVEALGLHELPKPETLQARGGVWFSASISPKPSSTAQ